MDKTYTIVRGPGFEMTREANMENNLEQLTLAVYIREKAPSDLHTQYPKLGLNAIRVMFNAYLLEAKNDRKISCIQAVQGYKDTGIDFFIKNGMPEFIRAYVKQTQYARLKTEEKLLLYTN